MEEVYAKILSEIKGSEWTFKEIVKQSENQSFEVSKIFGIPKIEFVPQKIGYINVSKAQLEAKKTPFAPRFNVPAIMLGTIFNNQKWENMKILADGIPSVKQLLSCNAVFIPGSTNSILDKIPQIEELTKNLKIAL